MTLTPTQQAICAVIRENGGFPITGFGSEGLRDALERCADKRVMFRARIFELNGRWSFGCTIGHIEVDGVYVSIKEYQQWAEQQNSKR